MKRAGILILTAVFLVFSVSAACATEVGVPFHVAKGGAGATITPYDSHTNDITVSLSFSGNDANCS